MEGAWRPSGYRRGGVAHEGGLGGGGAARPRPPVGAGPDKEGEGARVGAAAGLTWNPSLGLVSLELLLDRGFYRVSLKSLKYKIPRNLAHNFSKCQRL